jgi:hypothetical protein
MILAQNDIRLVSRNGSRERRYLSFIQPSHSIHLSYWLKFCIIHLINQHISINFFNNRYLAALSLLLMNLKVYQSSQMQTIQDVLWYESGLLYFVLRSANASITYIWIYLVWGYGSVQQQYLPGTSPVEMSLAAKNSPTSIDESHMLYVCNFAQNLQDMMAGKTDKQSHYKIISCHWQVTTCAMLQYASYSYRERYYILCSFFQECWTACVLLCHKFRCYRRGSSCVA